MHLLHQRLQIRCQPSGRITMVEIRKQRDAALTSAFEKSFSGNANITAGLKRSKFQYSKNRRYDYQGCVSYAKSKWFATLFSRISRILKIYLLMWFQPHSNIRLVRAISRHKESFPNAQTRSFLRSGRGQMRCGRNRPLHPLAHYRNNNHSVQQVKKNSFA